MTETTTAKVFTTDESLMTDVAVTVTSIRTDVFENNTIDKKTAGDDDFLPNNDTETAFGYEPEVYNDSGKADWPWDAMLYIFNTIVGQLFLLFESTKNGRAFP